MAAPPSSADEASQGPEQDSSEPLVWKVFTPDVVNPTNCQARTWAAGHGGQCPRRPSSENSLCEAHEKQFGSSKGLTHGFVTGPIPKKKLEEFQVFALQSVRSRERAKKKATHTEEKPADSEEAENSQKTRKTATHVGEKPADDDETTNKQKSVGSTPEIKKRRLHGKSSHKKVQGGESAAPSPKKLRRLKGKQSKQSADEGRCSFQGAAGAHASTGASKNMNSATQARPSAGSAPSCREDRSSDGSSSSGSSSDSDDDPSCLSATRAVVQEMLVLKSNEARLALLRVALHEKRPARLRDYVSAGVLQALRVCLEDVLDDDKSADNIREQVALAALKLLTCLPITTSHLTVAGLVPVIKLLRARRSSTQEVIHRLVLQLRARKGDGRAAVRSNTTQDKQVATTDHVTAGAVHMRVSNDTFVAGAVAKHEAIEADLADDEAATKASLAADTSSDLSSSSMVCTETELAKVEAATEEVLATNTSSELHATASAATQAEPANVDITMRATRETSTSSELDSASCVLGGETMQTCNSIGGHGFPISGECDQSSAKLDSPAHEPDSGAVKCSAIKKMQRAASQSSGTLNPLMDDNWRNSSNRRARIPECVNPSAAATIRALLELDKVLKS